MSLQAIGNSYKIGSLTIGEKYIFAFAITPNSSSSESSVVYSFAQQGQTVSISLPVNAGTAISGWNLNPSSTFLLGSSQGGNNGFVGYFHFVGFYDRILSQTELNDLSKHGLANSVPAVNVDGYRFQVYERNQPQLVNLSQATYFDEDNNPVVGFTLTSLPSRGTLYKNGVNAVQGTILSASDILTYQAIPNDFSSFNCSNSDPAAESFTSFTYQITDGLGDGSANCNPNSVSSFDPSCLSIRNATGFVCVIETNNPPALVNSGASTIVLTETNTSSAIKIQCDDGDTNPDFQLRYLALLSHNISLGAIFLNPNGYCNESIANFSDNVTIPISGNIATVFLCYDAFKASQANTKVGSDVIKYQCVDGQGATSPIGTYTVNVQNALQAGCGTPPLASLTPCNSYGVEDNITAVTLSGYDAATSHQGHLLNRRYRIESLPPFGTLYNDSDRTITLKVGDILFADNSTGNVTVYYGPTLDFFNSLCALNTNPKNPNSASIPSDFCSFCTQPGGCPSPLYVDALGVSLQPAVTFSYSLGYDDGTGTVFGEALPGGAMIYVLGVNDGPTELDGPTILDNLDTSAYNLVDYFNTNYTFTYYDPYTNTNITVTNSTLKYYDPDGDTYRVGFRIQVANGTTTLSDPIYKNFPLVSEGGKQYERITFLIGENCIETGASQCFFVGKAYKSDLNLFMSQLQIQPQDFSGGDGLFVEIYDPVELPGEFNPLADPKITAPVAVSLEIVLEYNGNNGITPNNIIVSAGLWAGIVGAGLFVLLSCIACWSCIFRSAREGEKAAVWLVRNVLCTDVEHIERPDLHSAAAGARKSLEYAVHQEHKRLARVFCCALFCRRACPCLVQFDEALMKIPDEEALIQTALEEEAHKIALKHRPDKSDNNGKFKNAVLDVEVIDVIAEDILVDDSIFDWEKHIDEETGKPFYYNTKTHVSQWLPPTVKVHEHHKIADRTSVKDPVYTPRPPEYPNPHHQDKEAKTPQVEPHPPEGPNPHHHEKGSSAEHPVHTARPPENPKPHPQEQSKMEVKAAHVDPHPPETSNPYHQENREAKTTDTVEKS